MAEEKLNIDELFRRSFEGHTLKPSETLLRKMRYRLWLSDFFSLRFRKFNILYSLLIIGGTVSTVSYLTKQEKAAPSENSNVTLVHNTPENDNNVTKKDEVASDNINKEGTNNTVTENNMLPVAEFIPSEVSVCAPATITFNNSSKNASEYHWDFGNGKTSDLKEPKVEFNKDGNYLVTLKASTPDGKVNTCKQTIKILSRPKAVAEINIDQSEIKTRKIVFTNHSINAVKYLWEFGDNTESSQQNAEHTYPQFSNYNVTLIALSDEGCADTFYIKNDFIASNYVLSFPPRFRPGPFDAQNNGYYEDAGYENLIFYPLNNGAKKYELKIFAPNGVEVFSTKDIKQGWNGFIQGRIAPPGEYSYEAKGVYPNGKKFDIKSSVELLVDEINGYY